MFRRMDILLFGITAVLTLFGLAMIASVSVFESYQITSRIGDEPSNAFYLWRSFMHIIVAFGGMFVTMSIPYRLWEKLALPLFGFTLFLLFLVFLPGISANYGTAASWLRIGPFSLQPSEFLKMTMVFYLAVWLQKREQLVGTWKEGFLPFATLLVISTILVAVQPDLGSFLVLSSIAVTMFFVAGGNIFHLMLGGSIAAVMGLPIILNEDYVRDRFAAFFSVLRSPEGMLNPDNPLCETIAYQICQALIAIGSGGPFGVGYGKSIQKFGYLPEVQADMIFSAMSEELGFFRMLIILGMYGVLVWRGYQIAQNAPDRFGYLVATGITTWIAFQSVLNIAVNLALFPLTGLTLPFISYGGSSLLANLMAIGILLNISMYSTEEISRERREERQPAHPRTRRGRLRWA